MSLTVSPGAASALLKRTEPPGSTLSCDGSTSQDLTVAPAGELAVMRIAGKRDGGTGGIDDLTVDQERLLTRESSGFRFAPDRT